MQNRLVVERVAKCGGQTCARDDRNNRRTEEEEK
jgi:hypothetical protein